MDAYRAYQMAKQADDNDSVTPMLIGAGVGALGYHMYNQHRQVETPHPVEVPAPAQAAAEARGLKLPKTTGNPHLDHLIKGFGAAAMTHVVTPTAKDVGSVVRSAVGKQVRDVVAGVATPRAPKAAPAKPATQPRQATVSAGGKQPEVFRMGDHMVAAGKQPGRSYSNAAEVGKAKLHPSKPLATTTIAKMVNPMRVALKKACAMMGIDESAFDIDNFYHLKAARLSVEVEMIALRDAVMEAPVFQKAAALAVFDEEMEKLAFVGLAIDHLMKRAADPQRAMYEQQLAQGNQGLAPADHETEQAVERQYLTSGNDLGTPQQRNPKAELAGAFMGGVAGMTAGSVAHDLYGHHLPTAKGMLPVAGLVAGMAGGRYLAGR